MMLKTLILATAAVALPAIMAHKLPRSASAAIMPRRRSGRSKRRGRSLLATAERVLDGPRTSRFTSIGASVLPPTPLKRSA